MPTHAKAAAVMRQEAEPLVDLYSIVADLTAAIQFCELAIQNHKEQAGRGIALQEGLTIAAVVTYVRCFMKGQREWLHSDDLRELSKELKAEHNFFYGVRQKTIAHSVNIFAETWVTASVEERDGVRLPITHVARGGARRIIGIFEALRLQPLATAVLAIIEKRITVEEAKLVEFLQTLSLDEVHAMDLHSGFSPRDDAVTQERKRFRQPKGKGRARTRTK